MQIFPRSLNRLPLVVGVLGLGALTTLVGVFWYFFSAKNLQVGYTPKQPVPYSHRLHAGKLGIDCRYCHSGIEQSAKANLPTTQVCMGCHALIKTDSPKLAMVRDSWKTDKPIPWVKIHKVPDHAHFNHSIHLKAGVGCVNCHGRIDKMDEVGQAAPLSMSWCLDCHRNPVPNLRPASQITNMDWKASPADQSVIMAQAVLLHPPQHCSGCHR